MVKTYKDVMVRQNLRQKIARAQRRGLYDVVARLNVQLNKTSQEESN